MKITTYLHREADKAIPKDINEEIILVLRKVKARPNMRTKMFRQEVLDHLKKLGWSASVRINDSSRINITSMKDATALCLQTGNMGRFYADLLKAETLYRNGRIKATIYILPMKGFARMFGSNIANFERFVEELKIFYVTLTVPILVFGVASEG